MSTEAVTTETQTEVTTETTETQSTETQAPQLTAIEQKASAQGWKPKEDWVAAGGDPDEWRSAREFVDRGEFLRHISAQNSQIKQLLEAQKNAIELNKKLAEAAKVEREIEDIRAEKRVALEQNDPDAIIAADEKLDEAKDRLAATKAETARREVAATAQPTNGETHPDFQRWVERNSWYTQNDELRDYADVIGNKFAKENPGIAKSDPAAVLAHVERKVRSVFKEQFTNKNREQPSAVETGGGNRRESTKKADDVVLDENETRVMKSLVSQGVMTEADYKAQIKALNAAGKR